MRRRLSGIFLSVISWCLATSDAQTPAFRSGIEVVRIDAVVVDAKGTPIRGLKAADFTVSEDGNPRPIVAFDAIELPVARKAEPGEAAWVKSAPRDVVTNTLEGDRLFMIVIDDAVMPARSVAPIVRAKAIARDVVSRMGVYDQAAVVFTMNSRKSQAFTADHARLVAAIDATTIGGKRGGPGDDQYDIASAWTLANAVAALKSAPQVRKTLVFISVGASFSPSTLGPALSSVRGENPLSRGEAARRILDELNKLFLDATRAHVNVYAFDANDFRSTDLFTPGRDYLRMVADETGGRASIANDDPVRGVTQMFRESSEYYVLGFTSASGTPGRHRVDVRTTYSGARVLARKAFEVAAAAAPAAVAASPLTSVITGVLPDGSLPMRVTATVLPGPTTDAAIVAIVLGINQPSERPAIVPERITAEINAYDPNGTLSGATKLDAEVALSSTAPDRAQYELLATLPLKPGQYQLRIAAHAPQLNVRGSVFVDVDVPNFSRGGVMIAPLLLAVSPTPAAAPADAFINLLPIIPTSHRSFGAADHVSVLARIVQGGTNPLMPVAIDATIVDSRNHRVLERHETLTPDGRAISRSVDYTCDLPMATIAVGDYLLTVKATTRDGTNEKTLRFSRR